MRKLIERKKGLAVRDFVMAVLIFGFFVALMIVGVVSLANQYDNPAIIDSGFGDKFNSFSNDTERIGAMASALSDKEGLSFVAGVADLFFSSAVSVLKIAFSMVGNFATSITGIGDYLNMPSEVLGIILTFASVALVALIVFTILSTATRRDI